MTIANNSITGGVPLNPFIGGGEDPPDTPMGKEMRILYNRGFKYDNKPAAGVVKSAAMRTGINPALLFSSAFQEGMNKALAKPDETETYLRGKGWFNKDYPVSGYDLYGLDTFGSRADEFINKGYLPADFKNRYTTVEMENDHMKKDPKTGKMIPDPQVVLSADFKDNESALMAKSAFLRAEMDSVQDAAKKRGIKLDDDSLNYFTLASYNAGLSNAEAMLDEYASAKDKKKFIKEGLTKRKGIHKNISPRLQNMKLAKQLLNEKE